jgi:hypothetical protein
LPACLEPNPSHDGLSEGSSAAEGADSSSDGTADAGTGSEGADASTTSATAGDGDGDGGSGDGDGSTGDGDDSSGDGDGTTGDGDTTTGDGDGDVTCASGAAGLVVCHDFEVLGGGGTVFTDQSGSGNDITTQNPLLEAAPMGQAIRGGAGAEYGMADSGSLDLVDAFTFEVWVNPDSLPTTGRMGFIDNDGQYSLMLIPTGLECGAGAIGHVSAVLPAGSWTYVACTWDGSELTLYFNGVDVAGGGGHGHPGDDQHQPHRYR